MTTLIVAISAITIGILALFNSRNRRELAQRLTYLKNAINGAFGLADENFEQIGSKLDLLDQRLRTGFDTAKRVDTQLNERLNLQGNSLRDHNHKVHMTERGLRDLDRRFTAISEALERRMSSIEEEIKVKTQRWAELFGPIWKTQDGFTVVAPIMSDSHLRNAIKWIEEHPQQYGRPELNEHYLAFTRELERRDNDDQWHAKLQGCPSPRQVLAEAVGAPGSPTTPVLMVKVDSNGDATVEDTRGKVYPVAMTVIETAPFVRKAAEQPAKRTKKARA